MYHYVYAASSLKKDRTATFGQTEFRSVGEACKVAFLPILQKMYLWWSLFTLYLHECQVAVTVDESVGEYMLLYSCDVFGTLINSHCLLILSSRLRIKNLVLVVLDSQQKGPGPVGDAPCV